MAIRFFDMFAGIGGFRSGLEAVGGFECIGHCEIDKKANTAYCAIYDSIGRCCVVPNGLRFQMVRSAALIRFDNTINPVFAEWLITSDDLQQQIAQSATQSSQANLFQGKIRKLHGYVPPIELQQQFASFVEQTDKSKLAVQKGLQELEILKKSLMQQYFG